MDYKKCCDVVNVLNSYFSQSKDIASIEYPVSIKYKSIDYYIYMFYSCLLDYGMRSKTYHSNLINTYYKYRELFTPSYVIKSNEEELKNIIVNNIHPRYPNIALKKWIKLSNGLDKLDILNILTNIRSYNELEIFINSLNCYGQKTGGLLMRVICDSKICHFVECIKSIPIDRHDIEISYLTRVIDKRKLNDREIKMLSDLYVDVGYSLNIDPSLIDKYLWQVGNLYCNKKKCCDCPLNGICFGGK